MTQPLSEPIQASHSGRSAMEITTQAARIAGKIIKDRFQTVKDIHLKGRADIVTDVDFAAEKAVLELLLAEYPNFGVLAEESKPIESDTPYRWIVDPLDGTRNYAVGIPLFCTVVALAKGDDVFAAVEAAKDYVTEAIRHAYPIGRGHGPLNHFHAYE